MGVGAEVDPVGRRAGWRAPMWPVPRTGLPLCPEPGRTEPCGELRGLARRVGRGKRNLAGAYRTAGRKTGSSQAETGHLELQPVVLPKQRRIWP